VHFVEESELKAFLQRALILNRWHSSWAHAGGSLRVLVVDDEMITEFRIPDPRAENQEPHIHLEGAGAGDPGSR
jgi:hypothetical protein